MIEGRPFLFQADRETVYHVAEDGVEVTEVVSWSSDKPIVALVDGDGMDFEPSGILRHRLVQLIVASSPKGTNPTWVKQLCPGSFVTPIAVKLWSPKELLLTGLVLAFLSTLD
jgi:hypothetical protein